MRHLKILEGRAKDVVHSQEMKSQRNSEYRANIQEDTQSLEFMTGSDCVFMEPGIRT